jgi:hypothetical protein
MYTVFYNSFYVTYMRFVQDESKRKYICGTDPKVQVFAV